MYNLFFNTLKEMFRVSCFTTTPYSQLMWASYANFHKGFCVEYTLQNITDNDNTLMSNLFPLVYAKFRPDLNKEILNFGFNQVNDKDIWRLFFNGVLLKSIDWAYQNERRLILPRETLKSKNYNINFFPISKVYLGNRMPINERKKIIEICNKKKIPYIGVIKDTRFFEMKECSFLCENCLNLKE